MVVSCSTKMCRLLLCMVLALAVELSFSAPQEDLVTDLPGLSKQPPFKHYSGYLKGDGIDNKRLHYWFVESSSNPHTDPVVLWLNGGPGCSSVLGLLTEHGPFQFKDDGSLQYNPYSWNQAANMIYLESPAGVGYSYSQSKEYSFNDDDVAKSNAIAVNDFFDKFPEFKKNDFYVTGESYGGIYVPTLVGQLMHNKTINLKGFAVGNGLSNDADNDNSLIFFAYYHGLIGDEAWNFLLSKCCTSQGPHGCNFTDAALANAECRAEVQKVSLLAWASGLDVYNLYGECAGGVNTGFETVYRPEEGIFETTYLGWPFSSSEKSRQQRLKLKFIPKDKLRVTPSCTNMTLPISYLNNPVVKKALHIPPGLPTWSPCSGPVSAGYERIYSDVSTFYKAAHDAGLRIMVYNGDVDMACNFLGDEWFVNRLGFKITQKRGAWYYKAADHTKQIAGFVKTFERMTLVTVKGAGHMVPSDTPIQALEMFINFIQDRPFNP